MWKDVPQQYFALIHYLPPPSNELSPSQYPQWYSPLIVQGGRIKHFSFSQLRNAAVITFSLLSWTADSDKEWSSCSKVRLPTLHPEVRRPTKPSTRKLPNFFLTILAQFPSSDIYYSTAKTYKESKWSWHKRIAV
jgi:hypothetical protein